MKRIKNLFMVGLLLICMTAMCAACGGQGTNVTEPDGTTVDFGSVEETLADANETTEAVTEEVTEALTEEQTTEEITTEEVTTEEVTTEEATTEEPTTEEPTTEEPTTEEPTTEAPVITGISAKVKGSHYIGDNLAAGDFTITVTYSDGSTKKNPAGWSADILNLAGASTTITVSYQGHTATVTVDATERPAQQAPANDGGSSSANNGGGSENEFPYEIEKIYVGNDCVYLFFNDVSDGSFARINRIQDAYKEQFGKAPVSTRTVGMVHGYSNGCWGGAYEGTVWKMVSAGYNLGSNEPFWP